MIEVLLLLACVCGTTILLESIPVLFMKNKKAWWKASVLCNVVTNPILNTVILLLALLQSEGDLVSYIVIVLEVVVVFLEAYFYRLMLDKTYKCCIVFSLVANGLSYGTGVILSYLPLT